MNSHPDLFLLLFEGHKREKRGVYEGEGVRLHARGDKLALSTAVGVPATGVRSSA